jgi:hypothetical protein
LFSDAKQGIAIVISKANAVAIDITVLFVLFSFNRYLQELPHEVKNICDEAKRAYRP